MTEEVMAQEMAQMEAEWQRKYDLSAIPNRLRTSSLKAVSDKFEYKAKVRNFGKMLVSREKVTLQMSQHQVRNELRSILNCGLTSQCKSPFRYHFAIVHAFDFQ